MSRRNKYRAKAKESYQGSNYVMCGRKASWTHERVKEVSRKFNQRFYECPHCGYYHLTKHK